MSGRRIKPRKIEVSGRSTSIRLEPEFYYWLRQTACEQGRSAQALMEEVERTKSPDASLSSALRVYVTRHLHDHPLP
jgi:predicted DNA-binding ribbon-helix-helix protein